MNARRSAPCYSTPAVDDRSIGMSMQWIEVEGASMRYEWTGDGDTTLVLVHEAGGSIESWDECLPALCRRRRVLRYDQRGFGLSEKVTVELNIERMVADLAGLLDTLGISRCQVAGSAMGAGIAIAFAARHPGRVERLLLQSPATGAHPEFRAVMLARADCVARDGMRAQAEQSLARSYPEHLRADRARYERYLLRWLTNDPFSYAAINRMGVAMDLMPELPSISCPTLVVGCTHDPLRPPEMTREIAARIPGARYIEADSGHFMAVATPALFAEVALSFLDAL